MIPGDNEGLQRRESEAATWCTLSRSASASPQAGHVHVDKRGVVHRCYHACKNRWVPALIVASIGFPFEHWLWENAPVLQNISERMGI